MTPDLDVPGPVGVLGDTHGRAAAAEAALATLRAAGAGSFLHCGDVGTGPDGRAVLDALAAVAALRHPVALVWGNMDYDRDDLARYARALGLTDLGDAGVVTCGGRRIGVTHGHLRGPFAGTDLNYVLSGHTHVPHDRRDGGPEAPRRLNPGALFRTPRRTAGLLDPVDDVWTLLDVELL